MKKNLIVALALVFVLGIAGTAFAAANPFVDVPAKHWAYDAVSKLAQAGILDGYGDGTYRGERLATRYEMAQATAKAMARSDKANAQLKALIDKLAVEFAAELNNLGVRVAKLEKNASTIKFTGDSRLYFMSNPGQVVDAAGAVADSRWDQRLRINAVAELNDKAKFYGRLTTNWRDTSAYGTSYQAGVFWDFGYFEWTMNPEWKIAIGRQDITDAQGIFWTNGGYDAIKIKYAKDNFKALIGYGDLASYVASGDNIGTATAVPMPTLTVDMTAKLGKDWSVNAAMWYSTNADKAAPLTYTSTAGVGGQPFQIYNLGVTGKLSEDFTMRANYFWNVATRVTDLSNDAHTGWVADLYYKGADKAKVNSWGVYVNYRDMKPWSYTGWNSGILGNSLLPSIAYGMKGFGVGANYTISKNAVLTVTYEKLSRNSALSTADYLPFWYVQMNVNF